MTSPQPADKYILLVEDSDDDAYFFFRALRKTGLKCQVDHVKDGAEALRYLSARLPGATKPTPDFIFLDLKLPAKSGFEILQWVQTQSFAPSLKIAILSGSDDIKDRARAETLGAEAYYVKPLAIEDLKQRLSGLSGQAAATDAAVSVAPAPTSST